MWQASGANVCTELWRKNTPIPLPFLYIPGFRLFLEKQSFSGLNAIRKRQGKDFRGRKSRTSMPLKHKEIFLTKLDEPK